MGCGCSLITETFKVIEPEVDTEKLQRVVDSWRQKDTLECELESNLWRGFDNYLSYQNKKNKPRVKKNNQNAIYTSPNIYPRYMLNQSQSYNYFNQFNFQYDDQIQSKQQPWKLVPKPLNSNRSQFNQYQTKGFLFNEELKPVNNCFQHQYFKINIVQPQQDNNLKALRNLDYFDKKKKQRKNNY
ncbi:unnamed protein product (macronuclear) [Paramecium tetraurelia]|uniref:Uncharacterized protein n=1 Tax=Paramecium tetraurelia TaxID=5888 RepID=A0ED69_PARTE|nr:uncharacterized protein GSPATT00004105001 [Paramecium tetraurelia]CAK93236.1 unnamed protein product [Paramecium tetraurelia]|eukprot:XP_001460633.1 hypothetical protein (macronuclear) [Paramecium tetraurelia strain d4-2]